MNKITLMLAGLCLCGAAMAQETTPSVSGSNTAVVIKKAQVKSATGNYQLLVVPVKGYDIAAGDDTEEAITLSSMFPANANSDKTVIVVQANGIATGTTYTCDGVSWGGTDPALPAGTIFWFGDSATATSTLTESTEAPIVFCGNANTTKVNWDAAIGQMTPLGNSTSDAITLSDVPGQDGAQLFRIKAGASDYEVYRYSTINGVLRWYKSQRTTANGFITTTWVDASSDKIPAAEAFYYYNPNSASN